MPPRAPPARHAGPDDVSQVRNSMVTRELADKVFAIAIQSLEV